MRILILFDVIKIKYHMPICTYRKSLCSQSKFKTESCRLILDHCIIMILMRCAVNEVAITERVKEWIVRRSPHTTWSSMRSTSINLCLLCLAEGLKGTNIYVHNESHCTGLTIQLEIYALTVMWAPTGINAINGVVNFVCNTLISAALQQYITSTSLAPSSQCCIIFFIIPIIIANHHHPLLYHYIPIIINSIIIFIITILIITITSS